MPRYLVCSPHTRREPPDSYIIVATSREDIARDLPLFADQPMYRLPDERPGWLTDEYLALIERRKTHKLGEKESKSLSALLDHVANGDMWKWFYLEQRSDGADPVFVGELGTWRGLEAGSVIGGLPSRPGRWHVLAVEPAPHSEVAAKLIVESTEAAF
jgi:hypothetical protein